MVIFSLYGDSQQIAGPGARGSRSKPSGTAPHLRLAGSLGLGQFIVPALLSLGFPAAVFDRLAERKSIAVGLVGSPNVGRWTNCLASGAEDGPGPLLIGFAGLMLLGDLVKLGLLRSHQDFTV